MAGFAFGANLVEVYSKQEVDALLAGLANSAAIQALTATQAAQATAISALTTALAGKVSGLNGIGKLWAGTAAQYAAITAPAADTVYLIVG